jgi:hypothetical protein
MNEFIQAVLIMVQFHKLALITESLHVSFLPLEEKEENNANNEIINSWDIKQKLLNNLEIINLEETGQQNQQRKSCDFSEGDLTDLKHVLEENKGFNKHIHSFCNVYHDFDPHSEEYRSYLVN